MRALLAGAFVLSQEAWGECVTVTETIVLSRNGPIGQKSQLIFVLADQNLSRKLLSYLEMVL